MIILVDFKHIDLDLFLFHFRLLSGVKKMFIFQLIDGKVTVRNNIIVTHLTHVSICCCLKIKFKIKQSFKWW
jgi:hypothetical protein